MALYIFEGNAGEIKMKCDITVETITNASSSYTVDSLYSTFCSEIGSGTSFNLINADDNIIYVSGLGTRISNGNNSEFIDSLCFATEGAYGLYLTTPSDTSQAGLAIPSVSRMFTTMSYPDIYFTYHYQSDLKSYNTSAIKNSNGYVYKSYHSHHSKSSYNYGVVVKATKNEIKIALTNVSLTNPATDVILYANTFTNNSFKNQYLLGALSSYSTCVIFTIKTNMIKMKYKTSDTWKQVNKAYVKVNDVWKPVTKVLTKVNGVWK